MIVPKRIRWAVFWLAGIVILAIAGDFVANQRPLYCRIGGQHYYPAWQGIWGGQYARFGQPDLDAAIINENWPILPYESVVFPLIPFTAGVTLEAFSVSGPLPPWSPHPGMGARHWHWLGTDSSGKDVAAGVVAGARSALGYGFLAMLLAVSLGLLMGSLAGYWGDERWRVRRGVLYLTLLGLPVAWFYGVVVPQYTLMMAPNGKHIGQSLWTILLIVLAFNGLGRGLSRTAYFSKTVKIPADLLVMRLTEIFQSVPMLLLVVGMSALFEDQQQGNGLLVMMVGLFSWPIVARFVRAEMLGIREQDFVTAARGMGLTDGAVWWRHVLPNALSPIVVLFAIVVGEFILLSAALSLLGYGGKAMHSTSWGGLLRAFKMDHAAWWLALFPTLCIALTTLAFNVLGEHFNAKK